MTEKELLYVDDALGHAQFLKTKCSQASKQLQDGELKKFVSRLGTKNGKIFTRFYQLMGE